MTFDKKKYDQEYVKAKYDRIPLNLPKGYKEKILKRAAVKNIKTATEYIKDLIDKDMQEENNGLE